MSFGVYIHWPYCLSKCPYCDYNAHVATHIDQALWRAAYARELGAIRAMTGVRRVDTIFFGGGTPSLMAPDTVEHVIQTIKDLWSLADDCEITLEANPTQAESEKFLAFRAAGVNRVSLGVQSLVEKDLKFLGRNHDVHQAEAAIRLAKDIFPRVSFDIIYGRPQQTEQDWKEELKHALSFDPRHISLYQLSIEEGTPFYLHHARGDFTPLPNSQVEHLYDVTNILMAEYGYDSYEVSSFCQTGEESRHNLIYWRYHDYAGVGPGAHGRITYPTGESVATRTHRAPDIWLERVAREGHGMHPVVILTPRQRVEEMVMMGLRLREGIAFSRLESVANGAVAFDHERIKALINEGLLHDDPLFLRATDAGRRCLNAVIAWVLQ
jgi:putative oxygen-independent coproporphyrinogen III oxidase